MNKEDMHLSLHLSRKLVSPQPAIPCVSGGPAEKKEKINYPEISMPFHHCLSLQIAPSSPDLHEGSNTYN